MRITFTGDTIYDYPLPFGFTDYIGTSTVNISGIGTVVFTDSMQMFVTTQVVLNLTPAAGFAGYSGGIEVEYLQSGIRFL